MKQLLFALLFSTLFIACNQNDDGPNYHFEVLKIDEATIPSSFELNQTYDITVKYTLPNGCHHFHSLYFQHENTSRIVAINSYVEEDVPCTEAQITKEYTFQLRASQSEDYKFKLWKGLDNDDEDIFEEIIVPVTDPSQA